MIGGDNRTAHLNARGRPRPAVADPEQPRHPGRRARSATIGSTETLPTSATRARRRRHPARCSAAGIKLIGLATRRHRHYVDLSLNRVQGNVIGGFEQDLDDQRDETLPRLVWTARTCSAGRVETGAEGVLNRLDSNVNLYALDAGRRRTRIDLPVDQAVVKEYRGEAFVNAGRPLTKTLRMDLGLTYEASRLTVTGDAHADAGAEVPQAQGERSTGGRARPGTPSSRSRAPSPSSSSRISSAPPSSTNSRVNGGNAELVPQRAWELLATLEHPILHDGLIKIEAGYQPHLDWSRTGFRRPRASTRRAISATARSIVLRGTRRRAAVAGSASRAAG